ncbi:HAMP domain-containing sensor histidine kinase [Sandaracinus amylolyticus]|uniref:histidine kinase n=1 Tax=Sandaracinus amylolyticus TaxID=927083 RepID=A0A0F6YPJ1_9BACT|nr:HAMP domain-containing sensor histidine kinase [Sandaracinus amylolyticus]AKF11535.1 Osmosensitive K+ channel histidine kinase KdpD [Sandaracinus amylolyticus]
MRLFSRLVVSHAAPVLVITVALAIVLGALGRMTQLVVELGEDELGTLAREGALHEADWNLDLSMRHALARCARGEDEAATEPIERNASILRDRLRGTAPVSQPLYRASVGYLDLADRLLASGVCSPYSAIAELERSELDARITTIWVERLAELHAAARAQEGDVGRLGTSALVVGVLIAAIALALAMWTARRMAAEISEPLAKISRVAQRLSRGDFGESLVAEGPAEIVELAEELERMRVRLAELESLKQGFLASISHELRTPLSKIREALALLMDGACGPLQERQARVVGIARTACEREIRIVTTLLDLSRLRAGAPLRRRGGVSVDDVLANAVAEEGSDARARRVTIDVEREGDSVRTALDEALLERAFANLMRNAVSVSKPGQVVRVTRTIERVDGRSVAVVRVRDEGPGVPDEVRDTLFEPFVTVAVDGSPKALGIGLGLALAREVARAHGGELELDATVDRGACFVMRLPLDGRESAPPRALGGAPLGVLGVPS